MTKTLYVGNLPHATTEERLLEVFTAEGHEALSAKICRKAGKSRGFGFVEMASEEGAEASRLAMDGFELDGRTIKVGEARPDKRNARPGAGDYGRDGGRFGSGGGGRRGRR